MNVKGKRIAVTGAAGRLGSRIVDALEAQGATVLAIVRDAEEEKRVPVRPGGSIHAFIGDVASESDVEQVFASITEQVNGLDGLVHTVGGWAMTPLLETPASTWRSLIDLNLTSAFLCFREAGRMMAEAGSGTLVAIAAGQGADRGAAGQAAYSAGKGGVVRLVEAADAELKKKGVRAGAVAPSMILFGGEESDQGVQADVIVQACIDLLSGQADGTVRREYGSMA